LAAIFLFTLIFLNIAYLVVNLRLGSGLTKLKKVNSSNKTSGPLPNPPAAYKVSVIIAMRNEEDVLEKCLNSLISQEYDKDLLEVILVNDRSNDNTSNILHMFLNQNPNLFKILEIRAEDTHNSPKKYALKRGLELAKGDIVLSTDADCFFGPRWVSSMVSQFSSQTGLILGLTNYYRDPSINSTLWGTQALEFFSHSVVSSSLVNNNLPVNANANNMAYLKHAFDEAGGFETNKHVVSGDDDFLLQKIHALGHWEIKYNTDPDSFVYTRPSRKLGQIWEQRKRWASKCTFYEKRQVIFLSIIYAYYCLILISLILLPFAPLTFMWGAASWVWKTSLDFLIIRKGADIFQQNSLLKWFLPAGIIHIPMVVFAVLFGSFGHFTWKGQRVKRVTG
jgi:cellulose synthase/poly-beta-1,6-N-acetylglucosamine synthase-like glycosyltransferase